MSCCARTATRFWCARTSRVYSGQAGSSPRLHCGRTASELRRLPGRPGRGGALAVVGPWPWWARPWWAPAALGHCGMTRAGRPYAGFCPPACAGSTAISLGPTLPSASSGLPEDSASSLIVLCLTLLRARFTERIRSPGPLVVSYTTVSPLPALPPAVCSLWHCLAGCPGWVLPTALLCGARTFLGTLWGDAAASPTRSQHPA